jgi:hypothetical protein
MIKPTPNPPETDATSLRIPRLKNSTTADRALDHYLCPPGSHPIQRKTRSMYAVTADFKNEELLADACETSRQPEPSPTTSPTSYPPRSDERCWASRN